MIKKGYMVELTGYQGNERWELKDYNAIVGKTYKVAHVDNQSSIGIMVGKFTVFTQAKFLRVLPVPNRDFLRDFVKMNNIKTTRVSKALGKSQNWLTQMMNDKRRDMTDETLKSVMKQLHIDWASSEFLHVRSEVPYRTRPANYTTTQHKERLQRDFWNGLVTK